tara:strand:+ start:228 stop:338 length:111 start_codon:yes stop_codon:yes gene_type:complete
LLLFLVWLTGDERSLAVLSPSLLLWLTGDEQPSVRI